ncbi:hypothetical protein CF326_g3380 [Tilletia indica]|nr:hypothetical protein CF326_g3380 [Tilletia indica]
MAAATPEPTPSTTPASPQRKAKLPLTNYLPMGIVALWPRRQRRRLAAIKELSNAHSLPDDVNCAHFGIHSKGGLEPAEIEKRQRDFGPNHFAIMEKVEGAIVCAAIITNVGLAFAQEWKTQRTMSSLPKIASATALVYRSGQNNIITFAATELVPGDIVKLSTGDIASVDLRSSASTVSGSNSPLWPVKLYPVGAALSLRPRSPLAVQWVQSSPRPTTLKPVTSAAQTGSDSLPLVEVLMPKNADQDASVTTISV